MLVFSIVARLLADYRTAAASRLMPEIGKNVVTASRLENSGREPTNPKVGMSTVTASRFSTTAGLSRITNGQYSSHRKYPSLSSRPSEREW